MTTSTDGSTPVPEPNLVEDIEKPEPDIYDPWKPENLKLPQEFLDQTMTTALLTTIPVEKLGDQEFIRVHPDDAHRFVAALITHQDERGARYLIHPSFAPQIGNIKFHLERLYLYTSRRRPARDSQLEMENSRKG